MFSETFAMIISLSLKCFTLFFFVELLIGYLKIFPLGMGGQMGKSTYGMGVVASVRVCTMGEGGQIFAILVRTYYLNDIIVRW